MDCSKWGSHNWTCKPCKNNYTRQTERIANDTKLKAYWVSLSQEQRTAWFQRNKATYVPGGRKTFDNAGFFEEDETVSAIDSDLLAWDYLTLDEWTIREKALDNVSGSIEEQKAQAKLSFEAKVMDRTAKTKYVLGQHLVGVFKGIKGRVGTERRQNTRWGRRRTVDDNTDLNGAQELAKNAAASLNEFTQRATARASVGISLGTAASLEIPDGMEWNPVEPAIDTEAFRASVKRDVLMSESRAATIQVQEEQDEHEASQSAKVRKLAEASDRRGAGAGRPRKLESELKSDLAKIIRDRAHHIADASSLLTRTIGDVEQEAKRQLGNTLPADIASILSSAKNEITELAKVMETARAKVAGSDIDALIRVEAAKDGEVAGFLPKLEDIKKNIFDETKPVFTVHVPAGNKSIAAMRTAVKKASQGHVKGRKQAAAAKHEAPPLAKKLMNKFITSADDNFGVKVLGSDPLPDDNATFFQPFLFYSERVTVGLQNIKGMAATSKWLRKEMEKNKDTLTYAMAAHKPLVARQIRSVLETHASSLLVGALKVPEEHTALIQDIFGATAFTQSKTHCNVGVTPYGLPEARLLTSGAYIVAGVPCANLTGETLKAKVETAVTDGGLTRFLDQCSGDDAKGFWAIHKDPIQHFDDATRARVDDDRPLRE